MGLAGRGSIVHGRRRGRRRIANSRVSIGEVEDSAASAVQWPDRIQDEHTESIGKDLEGGGLQRNDGWEWHELHTHRALQRGTIWQLQSLQTCELC